MMQRIHRYSARAITLSFALASAGALAQVVLGGTGFITVSVAGVGAVGGGLAGDARLPVTASGARFEPINNRVRISANGRRSAVRRIEIDVPNARQGQRIDLGSATGAVIHITLDPNVALDSGRGFVQFDTLTSQRGVGRYEGTFQQGQTPIVVRGQFQVTFSPAVAGPPGGANPGPGPTPGPSNGTPRTTADAGRR
jgi:hypothetical protein